MKTLNLESDNLFECEEWVKQGTNFTKSVSLLTILHIAVVFTHSA